MPFIGKESELAVAVAVAGAVKTFILMCIRNSADLAAKVGNGMKVQGHLFTISINISFAVLPQFG